MRSKTIVKDYPIANKTNQCATLTIAGEKEFYIDFELETH